MRTFETFYCSNCPVGYPRIDSTTKNEIALVRDSLNRQQATSTTWITPGDVIVICNASACVKYEVTSGGEGYHGISHGPQSPLTGGGGGGGGGDFGGGFGGGAAGEVTGEAVAVELALFGSVLRKIHGSAPIRNFVA